MRTNTITAAIALLVGSVAPATSAFAAETITFGGTLNSGNNNAGGPFGAANNNLYGTTYSVTLSYDPSLYTMDYSDDSCGAQANASCYFTISATRPVTEQLTIGGITKTFTFTSGGFNFTGGSGTNDVNINLQGAGGQSISVDLQSSTTLFPNRTNVNNPTLASLTNVQLSSGTFNQSGAGFNAGGNPTTVSASVSAVPEPASWAMMILGMGGIGFALRRRRKASVRVSYAA